MPLKYTGAANTRAIETLQVNLIARRMFIEADDVTFESLPPPRPAVAGRGPKKTLPLPCKHNALNCSSGGIIP